MLLNAIDLFINKCVIFFSDIIFPTNTEITLLKFSRIENFSPCVFAYINRMDALRQKMGLIWRSEIKLETQKEPNQTLTRTFCVCFGIL